MPNRILREGILESQRVNRLTAGEEVFYRRLMSIVDDYGRYEAHPPLLRARLYPLKLDDITDRQVATYLNKVSEQELSVVYQAGGKTFLQLLDFRQHQRSESRCPAPTAKQLKAFAQHMRSKDVADANKPFCGADALQVKANAHLVVFVCECVSEGVFVSEGVVVGGPPAPTDDASLLELERKPKGIETVIAFGYSINLSEDESRKFFEYNQARSWSSKTRRAPGVAAPGWRPLMRLWQQHAIAGFGEKGRGAKNSSRVVEPPFDPKKPNAHTGGLPIV